MNKLSLLALAALLAPLAGAQIPAPPATPPPLVAPPPVVPHPPVHPTAAAPTPTPAPAKEKSIYVPYDQLEKIFEKEGRGVFLPYREFIEMWNQLHLPELAKKTPPPVDGVLSSARYSGKVEGDVVTLSAKLDLEALKEGWSMLKLGAPGLSIAEAKTNAHLNFADNEYQVIFPEKGKYTLEMMVFGKIARDAGKSSVKLALPRTTVSQFELVIPEKGLDFTIAPASAFTSQELPEGGTKLSVFFGASQEIEVAWQKKGGETALKPLLFAETFADTRVSSGALRTALTVNYRILRAGVNAFQISLPAGQQVLSVDGADLHDWALEKEGERQKLVVNLHTPARDNYTLRVTLESGVAALPAKIDAPFVEIKNVERQSGSINVTGEPELVINVSKLDGLTQQSAAPAAQKSADTRVGSYRYLRAPYALALDVAPAQPQIEVTSDTLLTVEPETLTTRAHFNYDVKKTGIFSTQIDLPAGFEKAEATGENIESSNVTKSGNKSVLEVKFSQRRTGAFGFDVTADSPRKTPADEVTVPVFSPHGAQRHEARVGVAVHVSLKANTTDAGDLRQEDVRQLGALNVKDAQLTPLILGFRYRGEAKPARLAFEPRKPRVSVEVLALSEIREALTKNSWWLEYSIDYAGVNEFAISVPKAIADDIQIDGANIKEKLRTDEKNAKGEPTGQVVWRVILQDKTIGAYELRVSLETPRGELKAGARATVELPEIKPLNVFRETGQIAVRKDGNLEFAKTDATGLEPIDPKELHGPLARGQGSPDVVLPVQQRAQVPAQTPPGIGGVLLAYKYAAHPIALKIDVAKNLYLEVPSALVTYAVLNTVVAEDRAQSTEVIYWVKNNSLPFFSIRLPAKGRLLTDAFVNGQPQQPSHRADSADVLIRLPVQQSQAGAFPVRFIYEVPAEKPGSTLGVRDSLHIEPAHLTNAKIVQAQWNLYLPQNYRYIEFAGAMQEPLKPRGWEVFHRVFDRFVPRFGPVVPQPGVAWNPPPPLQEAQSGGFNFQLPKEGKPFKLRRLEAPSGVHIAARSLGWIYTWEAIWFFAAFFFGVRLLNGARWSKFAYAMIVGVGALIVAGAIAPRSAHVWNAIYQGVFAAVLVWFAVGAWRTGRGWWEKCCGSLRRRAEATRQQRPPVPPAAPPTPPATPSQPAPAPEI
jgi:hypothetical protein